MKCYNCGCRLSEHDFCTSCGADVSLYKKIMMVSNLYFNEGLEKAGVRDLSGAVTSLRQSLKFNKNNVDARNLLGLVYFEMGEVVAALSEWVISKNLRPNKNLADTYIEMVQSNGGRLDSINQTIKKYNQALMYCMQDSKDLAVIQLKKVLSLNPKFIRAHQLLALLYIDGEEWEKARKELGKCVNIDANNTLTLRYLREADAMLMPDENVKSTEKRKENDESVRYQSDNEIIIQPRNVREPKSAGFNTIFNVIIGLVIGMAAMYFLVLPAAVSNQKAQANKQVQEIGERLDEKTSTIAELEQQKGTLEEEKQKLQQELEGYVGTDGTLKIMDSLLTASQAYLETGDVATTAQNLEDIAAGADITQTSEAFQKLYQTLLGKIGPELAAGYYATGYEAYRNEEYEKAITDLSKAVIYDATNAEALYNLGNSYRKAEEKANAVATYQKVIELFPGTDRANKSQRYIDELNG